MSLYSDIVRDKFDGRIMCGSHQEGAEACALEAASVARGAQWSDDPASAGLPDLRPIQDAYGGDDARRTAAVVPLVEALWGWPDWTSERRGAWALAVALRTVQEILPIALRATGLGDQPSACGSATTLAAAWVAAGAAETTARSARSAARSAGRAASAAAGAARSAQSAGRAALAAAEAAQAARSAGRVALAVTAAAHAAARAAHAAARPAGRSTARADVLDLACRIWREEAERSVTETP